MLISGDGSWPPQTWAFAHTVPSIHSTDLLAVLLQDTWKHVTPPHNTHTLAQGTPLAWNGFLSRIHMHCQEGLAWI